MLSTWKYEIKLQGRGGGGINTYRFDVRLGQVFVQFPEMDEGEGDAYHVDGDPQDVEYVMAERAVHQGAARRVVPRFRVRCQSPAQKRRAQVDRDAREPYHERAEQNALENGEGLRGRG